MSTKEPGEAPLDRETYEERRAQLEIHLGAAGSDIQRAAYQVETGQAGSDVLTTAKGAVSQVEDKLANLEMAWAEAQRVARAKSRAADDRQRRASYGEVKKQAERRVKALQRIEKRLLGDGGLGADLQDYHDANKAIIDAMRPYQGELEAKGGRFGGLLSALRFGLERVLIGGMLFREGVNLSGVDCHNAAFQLDKQNLSDMVEDRNRLILGIVANVLPCEEREAA